MPARRRNAAVQLELDRQEALDTRPFAAQLSFYLPFPPSVNKLYRSFVARGHVIVKKTTEGHQYDQAVEKTLAVYMADRGVRPPRPPFAMTIVATPPLDGRKHDLDNLLKPTIDAVFKALGLEDDDITSLHVMKPWRPDQPKGDEPGLYVLLKGEAAS